MAQFVEMKACCVCPSSDARAIYDDGSWHCFSCGATKPSEEYIEAAKEKTKVRTNIKKKEKPLEIKPGKAAITREEIEEILQNTSAKGKGYRGITDETYAKVGVRHEFDEETGEVVKQYYPITRGLQAAGYKVRYEPKSFSSVGATGKDCDLFMQRNFQNGGKYVLIVSGECDAMAAYQMLKDYYNTKGGNHEVAVVSGTTGDKSVQQIAAQYKFFDTFDNIIVGYDNDESGNETVPSIVKVLPKGKTRIMKMLYKDANEYLDKDKDSLYVKHFFDATIYVPVGIVASNAISAEMREEMQIPKVPLPPFMHKLQDMMAGGIPLGRIVNLLSASGTGKSTITDEVLYYMLFHSPHRVGVVTLESTCGQYGIKLLSRHISQKIELLEQSAALALLDDEMVKKQEYELFNDAEGNPRFYLVDDRDGSVENIQDAIENLVIALNCKVIVLDPLSDIISKLSNEEQDAFMGWQKGMIKSHGITFLNVVHSRKTGRGEKAGSVGADLNEEDAHGSSAIYKSAACNLVFGRNKEAEDPIERNTTTMKATKIRWTGKTGVAGKYYYDNTTHTLYDLDDYFSSIAPETV
jgi:archaellum biogenesis ATPase FlaH